MRLVSFTTPTSTAVVDDQRIRLPHSFVPSLPCQNSLGFRRSARRLRILVAPQFDADSCDLVGVKKRPIAVDTSESHKAMCVGGDAGVLFRSHYPFLLSGGDTAALGTPYISLDVDAESKGNPYLEVDLDADFLELC